MEEYKKRIQRENRLLWAGIVLLAALDVLVGIFWDDLKFLDARLMTDRARRMQSMLLFGFLIYFIIRLVMNKKKLKNPFQMEEESRWQQDERRILVGEKAAKLSGELTLVGLTLAVFVTSLYNMDMFNALYYTLLGCSYCGRGAGSITAGNIDPHLALWYNSPRKRGRGRRAGSTRLVRRPEGRLRDVPAAGVV